MSDHTSRTPQDPVPKLLVFDVNETLSDLAPLAAHFTRLGAPAETAATWFATTLRDGFALTVTGVHASFAELATDSARTLLGPYVDDADAAAEQIVTAFRGLEVHDDVVEGVHSLRTLGMRMVTLSNGAASIADDLLTRAGVRDEFDKVLSADDAPNWKPAAEAYRYACAAGGVAVGECMLVASHPWDLHGASRAGLRTAWVNRADARYPRSFDAADLEAESLVDLAAQLGAVGA